MTRTADPCPRKWAQKYPEGHLRSEMDPDFFLGLCMHLQFHLHLGERELEEIAGVPRGTLDAIERRERALDEPLVRLVEMYLKLRPVQVRFLLDARKAWRVWAKVQTFGTVGV